ncbi:hypothetical protein BDZ91DRAFT_736961 [Kalaharituber pfeilii]|nr:hypothetical protein BDZ91DRAFT_736961 [Kalaharituber pfeilii]
MPTITSIPMKKFPPAEVRLGRIVQNVWSPSENFVDPDFNSERLASATTSTKVDDVSTIYNSSRQKSLRGTLTKLLSSMSSSKNSKEAVLQADGIETVKLMNPNVFFEEAITQQSVQNWLTTACTAGYSAFMITGYSIVKNLHVSALKNSCTIRGGTVESSNPLAVAGVGNDAGPLQGTVNIRHVTRTASNAVSYEETVWAILYRKIKLKTSIYTLSAKSKGWMVVLKPERGEIQQGTLIEAELELWEGEDLEEDAVEWEPYSAGGEDVYMVPDCIFEEDDMEETEDDDDGDD